ncbi:MAG TPA: YHS domain-containing protein [Candidatus Xenobia bacterium]
MYPPRRTPRRALAPLFLGMVAALLVIGIGFFIYQRHATPETAILASPAPTQPSPLASQKELLECLVCGRPVDPDTTQYKLTINGQRVFFDRQECLDAFAANPARYGRMRASGAPSTPSGLPCPPPVHAASAEPPPPTPAAACPSAPPAGACPNVPQPPTCPSGQAACPPPPPACPSGQAACPPPPPPDDASATPSAAASDEDVPPPPACAH